MSTPTASALPDDKPTPPPSGAAAARLPADVVRFLIFLAVLSCVFFKPLAMLAAFAWKSAGSSYVLLIPFVSVYLIRLRAPEFPTPSARPSWLAMAPALVAVGGLVAFWSWSAQGLLSKTEDYLAALTFPFVCLVLAGGFVFFGSQKMRIGAFPAALLFFTVPFPSAFSTWLKVFFQYNSADATQIFFDVFHTPYNRLGLIFALPTIRFEVAEECSGINSSVVLFIVSLIAGQMFLRSNWKRAFLTAFVVPLAIVRNGFRIFTLGILCIHVGPEMIDSPIHHQGGPIFFAISLIPFFLVLLLLRRSENASKKPAAPAPL